jgi:hypothetical protein
MPAWPLLQYRFVAGSLETCATGAAALVLLQQRSDGIGKMLAVGDPRTLSAGRATVGFVAEPHFDPCTHHRTA